eukprot:7492250-Pyramimonas_sp.AAC.1
MKGSSYWIGAEVLGAGGLEELGKSFGGLFSSYTGLGDVPATTALTLFARKGRDLLHDGAQGGPPHAVHVHQCVRCHQRLPE